MGEILHAAQRDRNTIKHPPIFIKIGQCLLSPVVFIYRQIQDWQQGVSTDSNQQELSYRKQIARKLRTQYAEGIYRHK